MTDEPKPEPPNDDGSPSQPSLEVPTRRARVEEDDGEGDASRKRLLLLVPLVMAAAALVALVLIGIPDQGGMYSKTVDQLVAEKAKFVGKPVRAEGNLVHGSLMKKDSPCEYRFKVEKNGVEVPVRYAKCVVPDTFRDVPDMDVGVTVEGELHADNSLEATQILAKCPSKYDMKQRAASGEKAPHATPSL